MKIVITIYGFKNATEKNVFLRLISPTNIPNLTLSISVLILSNPMKSAVAISRLKTNFARFAVHLLRRILITVIIVAKNSLN